MKAKFYRASWEGKDGSVNSQIIKSSEVAGLVAHINREYGGFTSFILTEVDKPKWWSD